MMFDWMNAYSPRKLNSDKTVDSRCGKNGGNRRWARLPDPNTCVKPLQSNIPMRLRNMTRQLREDEE